MRYLAVACDYDGTIAKDGNVDPETIASLERTKASGRRLILATGRELEDLAQVFPAVGLFDRVVGENGAIVHDPRAGTVKRLAEPPPPRFIQMLRDRGITPLSIGHVIVATRQPNETVVLQLIRDLGLELQLIFNKGAVMVLPSSINKGLGVIAALKELDLSPHNCVGVGDAENDHAFLSVCECSAAVANALPGIKERVDFVSQRTHGAGVRELLDLVITDDLRSLEASPGRHRRSTVPG
jgi:hydroxymethylpyrimidine pyrophosphatase-like HAD family hydrolase